MKTLRKLIIALEIMGIFSISNIAMAEELRCDAIYNNASFRAANLYSFRTFCLYINGQGQFTSYSIGGQNFRRVSGPWHHETAAWECSTRWGGTAQTCVFAKD